MRGYRRDGEAASGLTGGVNLVSSTHFAMYERETESPDVFRMISAEVLAAKASATNVSAARDETIIKNLNTKIDDIEWGAMAECINARTINCLKNIGIEFVWQFLERFPTARDFDEAKIIKIGPKIKCQMKKALKKLGLSFGIKFPDGFERRQPDPK